MADSYHHGDLRAALISAALQQLTEKGLEQLTLRKLADKVGVSRTGAYHHFTNKNDLICAVAAQGFEQLQEMMNKVSAESTARSGLDVRLFVREYLQFAIGQPELYELMFGRTIWKVGGATEELKTVAYGCFAHYAALSEQAVQLRKGTADKRRCLRLAQANWALIHGLCRLSIDGVYVESTDLAEVVDEAVNSMLLSMELR